MVGCDQDFRNSFILLKNLLNIIFGIDTADGEDDNFYPSPEHSNYLRGYIQCFFNKIISYLVSSTLVRTLIYK